MPVVASDLRHEMFGILPRKVRSITIAGKGFTAVAETILNVSTAEMILFAQVKTFFSFISGSDIANASFRLEKHIDFDAFRINISQFASHSEHFDRCQRPELPIDPTIESEYGSTTFAIGESLFDRPQSSDFFLQLWLRSRVSHDLSPQNDRIPKFWFAIFERRWIEYWQRKQRQYVCRAQTWSQDVFNSAYRSTVVSKNFCNLDDGHRLEDELRDVTCSNKNSQLLIEVGGTRRSL